MRRAVHASRAVPVIAAAGLLGLLAGAADAGPITGGGVPIATEQPSLGLTYLVRTLDPANAADLGQMTLFAGNFAPGGYSVANGQLLSISTNQVLFSQIGSTYGGNGISTFALPNLDGLAAVGTGQGTGLPNRTLGGVSGAASTTLTVSQLPPFGGASGIPTGSQPVSTAQPTIALSQSVVTQGFFPSSSGPQAQGPVLGQVLTYAGATLPTGQTAANGRQIPISQNAALFSILGNTYGGSFPTTFAVPDLNGRAAVEAGAATGLVPQALGGTAGAVSTTLSVANLPPQTLMLSNGTMAVVGGGQPISLQLPTLGLHYIIATQGLFPTIGGLVGDNVPFLGEISLFAGATAPAGWMFADGQTLAIAPNAPLFSVIGTAYGGNGINTFNLPNLQDRVAVGAGNGVKLGESFGADTDTLSFAQLPVGYPAALPPVSTVPEPPAVLLLLTGLAALGCCRRLRS